MSQFTIAGQEFTLTAAGIEAALQGEQPRRHPNARVFIDLQGRLYPVRQVLECATGIPRPLIKSHQAADILYRLGLKVVQADRHAQTPA